MSQLTLHEAMVEILWRHGGRWTSRDDTARGITADKLFLRPSDGQPPPSDQIRPRARNYQDLFQSSDEPIPFPASNDDARSQRTCLVTYGDANGNVGSAAQSEIREVHGPILDIGDARRDLEIGQNPIEQ